jgi:hypothetical protein
MVASFASWAVIVRLSAAPAMGVADAALRSKWVTGPTVIFAVAAELVALQDRHFAVTT